MDINNIDNLSVTDFVDFSTYAACKEKFNIYTQKTLKLRSITLTGVQLIKKNRELLSAIMQLNNELIKGPEMDNFNMDLSISKIMNPKVNRLPKCLANAFTDEDIYAGPNGMIDILNPNDETLTDEDILTDVATEKITEIAESQTTEESTKEVEKTMERISGNIVAQGDKELFASLDAFQKFVNETKYAHLYMEWKDLYDCLTNNCKEIKNKLVDDSFLYNDVDQKKFIMPIDLNNGKIRIHKFFEELTHGERRQTTIIENRYYKYLQDKTNVIKNASEKVKDSGVSDEDNPFDIIATNLDDNNKNTINTLF